MKKILAVLFFALVVMEIISWKVYTLSKQGPQSDQEREGISSKGVNADEDENVAAGSNMSIPSADGGDTDENAAYPRIFVEEKNGVTERTIHMGVRQWAWDPSELRVKQGELVRLVIHNADVRHAIVIPDLGIEADIPEEGAIVEFTASRRGTFDFLCATYCGTGHAGMQGRIIVE